ncbi:MAG TPA: shikimate kinase [Clostridiales bacterium]|nr:shikimate kinase [Clostridiales bacterium]
MMLKCGLLGEKLGHSYSPQIHSMLADYEYELFEKSPEELEAFLKSGEFDGLNVTIPYKKAVMPYCTELSPTAAQIGSVNTIVRRSDGSLYGDNTDAFGFENLIVHNGIEVKGKKALVLGTGGASVTAQAVLKNLGASEVVVISRKGEDNYENIAKHADTEIIANTTPVGMYPNNGKAAVDLTQFPKLSGVLDVVYNPARTALLLQAERLGIPCAGGLYMLVSQAKRSCELFTGKSIPDSEIDRIERVLSHQMQNIVIIGMPGSGKTTVSTMLAEKLGRKIFDTDTMVAENAGMTIPEIFAAQGEAGFRRLETEATAEVGKLSGNIISTGGGVVTVAENYELLHQNGVIVWIERDTNKLARDGRPISLSSDLNELYAARLPLYDRFADIKADNNGDINDTVNAIMEMIK